MKTKSLKNPRAGAGISARVILAVSCTLSSFVPAFAQDRTPDQQVVQPEAASAGQNQTQSQAIQNPPVSRPIPQRTVGLAPGKIVQWTLRDAVIAALEKNVDIELERENVRLATFDVLAAHGVYDPLLTSSFLYNSQKSPNIFVFSGSTDPTVEDNSLSWGASLQKQIEKFGTAVRIDFNNRRRTSNVSNFSPEFRPNMVVNLTQPLFRNFSIDQNRRSLKLARRRLDLSDAQFRQRAIEIISRVQQAYWDLAFAIRDEEIQRDSVKLAETQLQQNQRQVEVGTLAPIDVVSAATQLESRRQQVFVAMNTVSQAENALKNLTVEGPGADLWDAQIVPTESFDIKPVVLPLDDAFKLARENRPELKQLGLQKEINSIDIDFFSNQAKPQIDFVASYTTAGIGGQPNEGVPPGLIFPQFIGGYGTGLKTMFKQDFPSFTLGVNFSFPLRNRTAKANLGRARETDRQIDLQTRRMLQNIEVEVRNAVQAVETAKMRIDASRAAREYAEQQLEGEEKKFQAGLSTTFFILQRQTELAQARGVELRALADYNKSVSELQRVISTTLSSNNIEVQSNVDPVR